MAEVRMSGGAELLCLSFTVSRRLHSLSRSRVRWREGRALSVWARRRGRRCRGAQGSGRGRLSAPPTRTGPGGWGALPLCGSSSPVCVEAEGAAAGAVSVSVSVPVYALRLSLHPLHRCEVAEVGGRRPQRSRDPQPPPPHSALLSHRSHAPIASLSLSLSSIHCDVSSVLGPCHPLSPPL